MLRVSAHTTWSPAEALRRLAFGLSAMLALGSVESKADGWYFHHHGHYGWYSRPGVTFYYTPGPVYAPVYYPAYPVYADDYVQRRPNYAVGGTLLGALAGGLIGHGIHHQGWEGAGIGAAAGLVLGGLAEHNARARERAYSSTGPVSYAQTPAVAPQGGPIADSPTVQNAPVAPVAPTLPVSSTGQFRPMSGANSLFGR